MTPDIRSGDDAAEPPELPRAVALAWGVAAHPQRGPKRELSIERIVEVGVRLADERGLGAVSMAAVAGELGVSAMALYRYVSAKDDLVVLMQEAAIGVPPSTLQDVEGWRDRLAAWSRAQVAAFAEHPWLLDVPITGTPVTPNNLAWMDDGLAALEGTALTDRERTDVLLAVLAQGRWQSIVERGTQDAARDADETVAQLDERAVAVLSSLVTPEQFPHVHRVLVAGVLQEDAGAGYGEFGLGLVLDGVAAHLEGHGEPASAPSQPETHPRVRKDARVREATSRRRELEKQLRDARAKEREAIAKASERLSRAD